MEGDDPAVKSLRRLVVDIGSKTTLEILAKAFHNN
jgi:hypothetical protein